MLSCWWVVFVCYDLLWWYCGFVQILYAVRLWLGAVCWWTVVVCYTVYRQTVVWGYADTEMDSDCGLCYMLMGLCLCAMIHDMYSTLVFVKIIHAGMCLWAHMYADVGYAVYSCVCVIIIYIIMMMYCGCMCANSTVLILMYCGCGLCCILMYWCLCAPIYYVQTVVACVQIQYCILMYCGCGLCCILMDCVCVL